MIESNVFFEQIEKTIKQELLKASSTVKICVAWFSYAQYEYEIKTLRKRGVKVELICNLDHINSRINPNDFDDFHWVKSYLRTGIMHHKFCIVDDSTIITGSYNWSANARNHLENIIILKNDFDVIKAYLHQFHDIKMLNSTYQIHIRNRNIGLYCTFKEKYSNRICKSTLVNIFVCSLDRGPQCRFSVWKVCLRNHHVELLEEYCEDVFDDTYTYQQESQYICREEMLIDFHKERKNIENYVIHKGKNRNYPIHALAYVEVENSHDSLEYLEEESHCIRVYWADMLYRKNIASSLHIESIISWAQPSE